MIWGEDKPKRKLPTKAEWQVVKSIAGNKCVICGITEKKIGVLDKAHIKANSRSGSQYFPLCPNCHRRFDKGLLTLAELKKLKIPDKTTYKRLMPKRQKKTGNDFWF